jgi:hypothetical protein
MRYHVSEQDNVVAGSRWEQVPPLALPSGPRHLERAPLGHSHTVPSHLLAIASRLPFDHPMYVRSVIAYASQCRELRLPTVSAAWKSWITAKQSQHGPQILGFMTQVHR